MTQAVSRIKTDVCYPDYWPKYISFQIYFPVGSLLSLVKGSLMYMVSIAGAVTNVLGNTCASRITPRRSSIHRSFPIKLPSSCGSKQLVKQTRPLAEVMVEVSRKSMWRQVIFEVAATVFCHTQRRDSLQIKLWGTFVLSCKWFSSLVIKFKQTIESSCLP